MHTSGKYQKTAILLVSFLTSVAVYLVLTWSTPASTLRSTRIEEWYGFLSIGFLFLAMLAGPFYRVFPSAPYKGTYYRSLGGFGISAFYFALLHSCVAFFQLLFGFKGLSFLVAGELMSVSAGFVALFILALLGGTSFTWAMKSMGKWWKVLHRFVYLAALAVLVHILLVGNQYENTDSVTYLITSLAVVILLVLHGITLHRYFITRFPRVPSYVWSALLLAAASALGYGLLLLHHVGHHHV